MTSRLLIVVCLLSALSLNRDSSCAAITKTMKAEANILGIPTPSQELRDLQLKQINDLRQTFRSQIRTKRQLEEAMKGQKKMMHELHASNRKAFFDLQAAQEKQDTQLADEQVAQQALNNIMVVVNEVGRLVQWKSVSLDTFLNNNFPDLTNHLKMMITTAYANAHILGNTQSSDEIKELVSKLVNSTESLTRVLVTSVRSINQEGEKVVKLFDLISAQAVEQQEREADLLKRALAAKEAEKDIFNRARALIATMRCPNATDATTTAPEKKTTPLEPKKEDATTVGPPGGEKPPPPEQNNQPNPEPSIHKDSLADHDPGMLEDDLADDEADDMDL